MPEDALCASPPTRQSVQPPKRSTEIGLISDEEEDLSPDEGRHPGADRRPEGRDRGADRRHLALRSLPSSPRQAHRPDPCPALRHSGSASLVQGRRASCW